MGWIDEIRPLATEEPEPVSEGRYGRHAGAQGIIPDGISFIVEDRDVILIRLDVKDRILKQDYTDLAVLVGEPDGFHLPDSRTAQ